MAAAPANTISLHTLGVTIVACWVSAFQVDSSVHKRTPVVFTWLRAVVRGADGVSQHATGGRAHIQQLVVSRWGAEEAAASGQHTAHNTSMWENKPRRLPSRRHQNMLYERLACQRSGVWALDFGGFLPPSSESHQTGNDNGLSNPAADEGPAAAGHRQSEQCEWR